MSVRLWAGLVAIAVAAALLVIGINLVTAEPAEPRSTLADLAVVLEEELAPDPLPAGDPLGEWEVTTPGESAIDVAGWALDPDTQEAVTIRASAGDVVVDITTGTERLDIGELYPYYGNATGFAATVDVPAGDYDLCLTVVNSGSGADVELGCQHVVTTDSVTAEGVGLRPGEQPQAGEGTFTVTSIRTDADPNARVNFPLSIQVEDGLKADVDEWATYTLGILNDPRGWSVEGYHFTSDPEAASVTLILASPDTVDRLCAPLATNGYTSCQWQGNTVINVDRWVGGVPEFLEAGGTMKDYRDYVINHEIGHAIGYGAHETCPAPGELAPIMQQQTFGMQGCVPNGWPYPNE